MENATDEPALVGTATCGQLAGFTVEVWSADPEGWYVLYFPPGVETAAYNSWGEGWGDALEHGARYGVVWESGYAL